MSCKAHVGMVLMEQGDSGILSAVRLLLKDNPLRVVGEVVHETRFKLVSKGATLQNVRKVVGRPDVLRMCRGWLSQLLGRSVELEERASQPGELPLALTADGSSGSAAAGSDTTAYLIETYADVPAATTSTAAGAAVVDVSGAGGGGGEGGGKSVAAPLHTLAMAPEEVLEHARCVVLSQGTGSSVPSGHDKTMLYFCLDKEEAGTLQAALECLHRHGVNLLSIRSYATEPRSMPGVIDFIATSDGHETEPALTGAIAELRTKAAVVKVLGSFAVPRGPAVNVVST